MWNVKYKDTNELICETRADIENRFVVAKGEGVGEGRIGSLGLAETNYYIWNG